MCLSADSNLHTPFLYRQEQTGCNVYAPGIERDFTEHPILEPAFLYGGNPPKTLQHKFLMAQGCNASPLEDTFLPDCLQTLALPGHSWDMVGFRTKDDVIFLADSLSSRETLEKYRIGFLVDVRAYLETLESIQHMDAKLFIPSHAEPTDDIRPLAELNVRIVHEIADDIVSFCASPASFETILKELFDRYRLTMSYEQHSLVGSTVRSYLTWLTEENRLKMDFLKTRWSGAPDSG